VSILSTGSRICVSSSGTWSGVVVAAAFPWRSLWVPETSQQLRDLRILVDQAAELIASDHRGRRICGPRWERAKRRGLAERPVRAGGVEMSVVRTQ
jgi:ribosomal protein L15E